jgi:hypothetical protein
VNNLINYCKHIYKGVDRMDEKGGRRLYGGMTNVVRGECWEGEGEAEGEF